MNPLHYRSRETQKWLASLDPSRLVELHAIRFSLPNLWDADWNARIKETRDELDQSDEELDRILAEAAQVILRAEREMA